MFFIVLYFPNPNPHPHLSLETKLNPLFVLYYAASLGMIACLQQLLHARWLSL